MKFNKLLLGAALVTPLFMGSCNPTVTIDNLSVYGGYIYNYGKNTVTLKIGADGVTWSNSAKPSDFEIDSTSLKGKKIDKIVKKVSDKEIVVQYSGNIETPITTYSEVSFNINTAAFAGTKKVKKATGFVTLDRARIEHIDDHFGEDPTIAGGGNSYYGEFNVIGTEVNFSDYDKTIDKAQFNTTFDDSKTEVSLQSKNQTWGKDYFLIYIKNIAYQTSFTTDSFSIVIPTKNVSVLFQDIGSDIELELKFSCPDHEYIEIEKEWFETPTFYFTPKIS